MDILRHASDGTYQLWNGNGTTHNDLSLEDLEQHLIGHIHD